MPVRPDAKPGNRTDKHGYKLIWVPDHPRCNSDGRVQEHRLVMEAHIGRHLLPTENVHHKNGIRGDNRIENLELWSRSQPYGQRVSDKIAWAIEFLGQHGYTVDKS